MPSKVKFEHICLGSLTLTAILAIAFVGYQLGMLERDLRFSTVHLLNENIKVIGGSATNVEKGLREWKNQSKSQADAVTTATTTLTGDLRTLGTLLSTADATLDEQRISLRSLKARMSPLLISASSVATKSGPLVDGLQRVVDHTDLATKTLAESATRIMPHVESIAASVDITSHDSAVFVGNLDTESDLLVGATRRALTPQSRKVVLLKALGGNAVTIMEALYYIKNGG